MLGFAFFHGEQIVPILFLILIAGIVVLTAISALLVRAFRRKLGNQAYWFAPIPFVVAAGSLYFWYWTEQPGTGPPVVLMGKNAARLINSKVESGSDFGYWGLAFFKEKLYVSTNLGLLEIESGDISKLYRFQRQYSVVSGPWLDAADKLLWVEDEETTGLAKFDGAQWTRVPMPRGDRVPSPGSLPQFTSNSQGFWAVIAGNVWRWDSATAKWFSEDTPEPHYGEGVIGVMPLRNQLLFIYRHELFPFLVRPSQQFKPDTVVMEGTWREVHSEPGLRFMTDSSTVTDDAGYICTTTGDILRVTTKEIAKLDTPGECETLASASGKLVAGFRRKGIYEYQNGEWHLRAAHPYPSGEGDYWSHLAADGAELSYSITGRPVVDRAASSAKDIEFTRNAPRAVWVLRGPEFQQVMIEGRR
jgi:hypothetical protein